jgi:hypothetical protein
MSSPTSPNPAGVPALPPYQTGPNSPSNSDCREFDATVHHPFDEDEEEQEGEGTSMAVAEPGYNERGSVSAITSARKSKYKKKSTGNTSSRHASKSKKHQIAQGKRVYVERRAVKYLLDVGSEAFQLIELYPSDKFRFFGVCLGKAPNSKLYKVRLDLLPSNDNEIVLARKDIEVLGKGEEELPYLPSTRETDEMIEECAQVVPPTQGRQKTVDYVKESYDYFSSLSLEMQAIARSFTFKYGKEDENKIEWRILSEAEQITVCPMEGKSDDEVFHEDIPWSSDPNEVDYNTVLFEKFFPSLKGKAKLLDEFLRRDSKNPRQENPWKRRVEKDNILFHREGATDPDELVSNFFMFLWLL